MAKNYNVTKHRLVPEHTKLTDKDKDTFLKKYCITIKEVPKILISDPVLESMKVKDGDIIKIKRVSLTAGVTHFYRRVSNA